MPDLAHVVTKRQQTGVLLIASFVANNRKYVTTTNWLMGLYTNRKLVPIHQTAEAEFNYNIGMS